MPYQDCNILTKFFNAVVGSEILLLTDTTSSKENFQKLITTFLIRMHIYIYIYIYICIVEIHEKYREFEIKLYYKSDVFCFCIV